MSTPIFSDEFLRKYLYNFTLSSIPNIRKIKNHIENLIKEKESKKLMNLKEEEVKSRFVNTFFGDILGFNYGNSEKWMLREEKKSKIDGTKPDAALGYFFIDKQNDDVRAIIEIKDAKTELDKPQKRIKTNTPVEQAFEYAPKMGGNCKWVIVSNIIETRFYSALDRSKYQVFYLEELEDENKLKELLYLFHKDRFIMHDFNKKSNSDILLENTRNYIESKHKTVHVIDQIYYSLKRFSELIYVDPNYLASIKPFNIFDEYVWHYYDSQLFTINSDIYNLLNEISINNNEITLSETLKQELVSLGVTRAEEKLKRSFKFLNNCFIKEIRAVKDYSLEIKKNRNTLNFSISHIFSTSEGNSKVLNINSLKSNNICDCIICNYRSFQFDKLIRKLKEVEGDSEYNNLEYAYGNYLISSNEYKTSYTILKDIQGRLKGKPESKITYFLATYNIKLLYNLMSYYDLGDKEKIRSEIRDIDIDKVLYEELEFYVEKDVVEYLRKIKEDYFINRKKQQIEDASIKIIEHKRIIDNGGGIYDSGNYPRIILESLYQLSSDLYQNRLFLLKFSKYKKIVENSFGVLLTSYNTPRRGLLYFNEFILSEAILNIFPKKLEKILKEQNEIETNEKTAEILLDKLTNLLCSYFKLDGFNRSYENDLLIIQSKNWHFLDLYRNTFSNFFIILSKINISVEQFSIVVNPLISFLEIETILFWYNIDKLGNFIKIKGSLFAEKYLEEILIISIKREEIGRLKYGGLIASISFALQKFYPGYRFSNETMLNKIISDNLSVNRISNIDYKKLIDIFKISNKNCKEILIAKFEERLDSDFDYNLYELLLSNSIIKYNRREYFHDYVLNINKTKGKGTHLFGSQKLTDLVFMNFVLNIYNLDIDLENESLQVLSNLNKFETWLLNPYKFNYQEFNAKWIIDLKRFDSILKVLAKIPEILEAIDQEIKINYNPILAEIKYKYLIK